MIFLCSFVLKTEENSVKRDTFFFSRKRPFSLFWAFSMKIKIEFRQGKTAPNQLKLHRGPFDGPNQRFWGGRGDRPNFWNFGPG